MTTRPPRSLDRRHVYQFRIDADLWRRFMAVLDADGKIPSRVLALLVRKYTARDERKARKVVAR